MAEPTLYQNHLSANCYKVRLLLHRLGVEYESVEVDVIDRSGRRPETMGGSLIQRIPTIDFGDGRWLGESNAILWHFARGTDYLPEDPWLQSKALQWMFFEQYDVEPNLAVARFWVHILEDPERFAGQLVDKHAAGNRALSILDAHFAEHDFAVGERYSIADIALYGYTHVAGEGGFDLDRYPSVRAWHGRVAAVPGHLAMKG